MKKKKQNNSVGCVIIAFFSISFLLFISNKNSAQSNSNATPSADAFSNKNLISDNRVTTVGGVGGDLSPTRMALVFNQIPKEISARIYDSAISLPIKTKVLLTGNKALIKSEEKPFSARFTCKYFEVKIMEGVHRGEVAWLDFYELDQVPDDILKSTPVSSPN